MRVRSSGLFVACVLGAAPASAQASAGPLPDEAVSWLQPYLRVDRGSPHLQFVEPLAMLASERFARHCGALVTSAPASGGAR